MGVPLIAKTLPLNYPLNNRYPDNLTPWNFWDWWTKMVGSSKTNPFWHLPL